MTIAKISLQCILKRKLKKIQKKQVTLFLIRSKSNVSYIHFHFTTEAGEASRNKWAEKFFVIKQQIGIDGFLIFIVFFKNFKKWKKLKNRWFFKSDNKLQTESTKKHAKPVLNNVIPLLLPCLHFLKAMKTAFGYETTLLLHLKSRYCTGINGFGRTSQETTSVFKIDKSLRYWNVLWNLTYK